MSNTGFPADSNIFQLPDDSRRYFCTGGQGVPTHAPQIMVLMPSDSPKGLVLMGVCSHPGCGRVYVAEIASVAEL